MKFCFLCGKVTNKLIEGYCEECYNKKSQLIQPPEKIDVIVCGKCGSVKERNVWKRTDIENLVKRKIKILGDRVNVKVELNDSLKIHAVGFLKNSKKVKEEDYEILLKKKKVTCPSCLKRLGNYVEGVIQLRGNVTKEILDFIDDQMASEFLKDAGAFYKIQEVKGGFDLSFGDNHIANKISDILKKKFKLEIKKTYRLLTRKQGKNIYKIIVLVRIY